MKPVDAVVGEAATRFRNGWAGWAIAPDGAPRPLTFSLGAPGARELESDVASVDAWIRAWTQFTDRHSATGLRRKTVTTRIGKQSIPTHLDIATPGYLANLLGQSETWAAALAWSEAAANFEPESGLSAPLLRALCAVPVGEIGRLMAVASWLRDNPRSGLMPRQLPVEGIDTKWIAGRYRVLKALLRPGLGQGDSEPDAPSDADDSPEEIKLTALGLRPRPHYVRLTVLDSELRAALGGLRDVSVATEQLSALTWSPDHLLVVENLETAVSLPDMAGTVVVHSLGHDIEPLRGLGWALAARRVTYWGDIDAEGLAILSRVRGLGYPAASILMDAKTLFTYQHLAVSEPDEPRFAEALHLTAIERETYEGLRANRWGERLRLEQERIPLDVGIAALENLT